MHTARERKKNKADMIKYQHLGNMGEGYSQILCTITATLQSEIIKFKVERKNKSMKI